jgi:hypothetical protein
MKYFGLFKNHLMAGATALTFVMGASGVRADLNEIPPEEIYSLITPTTSVYVCGTLACDDNTTPDAVAPDPGTRPDSGGYALFSVYEIGPAGSGFIDPFLRFQHNEGLPNGSANIEYAYNTDNDDLQGRDGLPYPYDYLNQAKDTVAGGKKDPGDFNHAILFDDMLAEDGYFTFLLDINEPNSANKSTLRLDELSFFISTSPTLSVYDPLCNSSDAHTNTSGSAGCFRSADNEGADTQKVWDMDLDAKIASVLLDNVNATGKAGSGDYDLKVQLPEEVFEAYLAAHPDQDLYVFLENTAGFADDDNINTETQASGEVSAGFEEWAFIAKTDLTIPVPGTLVLTGLGLLLLSRRTRC